MINKGPTIFNGDERAEIVRRCKFVDEVIPDTPYTPTTELMDSLKCQYYAHGDDPVINSEGFNVTEYFKGIGRLLTFKRTEGVSTTDITGKLLALAELKKRQEEGLEVEHSATKRFEDPPKQQFLATSRRIVNFANTNLPKPGDTIVYIQGSWDILHHGHLKRIEEAKKLGDFLYVGIWDDEMTRFYKGDSYPIVSVQERVLMCLACKHVDDVVIGAPYIITKDLIKSLNISKVVRIVGTDEDRVLEKHRGVDAYEVPREMGMLHEVSIDDPFFDVTTEAIAARVMENRDAFKVKFDKKSASQKKYYEDKEVVQEVHQSPLNGMETP
jgi:ethanolamine-phosphate cytidylyltransferase